MNSLSTPAESVVERVRDRFRATPGAFALVVSGPSGVGKTSICKALLEAVPEVRNCVTSTTRAPRKGEVDGVDYHFLSDADYDALVENGAFLERADVHGHRYGCTGDAVAQALSQGTVVLLEVDVQGARTWRQVLAGHAVSLFLLPPSVDELRKRLTNRKSEAEDALRVRLENAMKEIREAPHYDYTVVNRDLDEAVACVNHILEAEKNRTMRVSSTLSAFGVDI